MKFLTVRNLFLLPIFLTMIVSISHVITWYDIANPIIWAIFMSISIEVGAMVSLIAATKRIKGGVWFMFGIVTFIQMIGNIFYSYKEIDSNGDLFKSWVELTSPVWELLGSDTNDIPSMKRWLSFLEGGLLPIISLTSLHFFVKYEEPSPKETEPKNLITETPIQTKPTSIVDENTIEPNNEILPIKDIVPLIVDEEVNETSETLLTENFDTPEIEKIKENITSERILNPDGYTISKTYTTSTTTEKNKILTYTKLD